MTGGIEFQHVCGEAENAQLDVLFIHGLTGDSSGTWSAGETKEFWPAWLCENFPSIRIYTVGYPSSIFVKWAKKEMNIHERASNIIEQLASCRIGMRPIAFVTHSLGGLLAKEIMRACNESGDDGWHSIIDQTKLVIFMATPHKGAAVAATVKLIAPRISSKFIDLLSNDSGYLTNLNQSYRDLAAANEIYTISYYEKFKTNNSILVVSAESADPGVGKTRTVGIDADHINICKPVDRDALIYISLCRHLEKVLESCPAVMTGDGNSFAPDDYSQASDTDRRNLLQKLIDAGREYEYQKANDLQNKFARKYHKLGLYTDAKQKNDAVLSAVEQRFITHVFNTKICNGANDEEIATALQNYVIDPIARNAELGAPSPSAVLQALYFLTEQCYIQWDKP